MKLWHCALAVFGGVSPVVFLLGTPVHAEAPSGGDLFKQKCQMCHSVAVDKKPGPLAPNLRGVVGRKAGSTGFTGYSSALKSANITWNSRTLDAYLAAPGNVVPGTRMVVRVTDPNQRRAMIAWLGSQR